MCEAKDWCQLSSKLCLICFILCVFLDIHTHSHAANGESGSGRLVSIRSPISYTERLITKYGNNFSIMPSELQKLMENIGLNASPDQGEKHEGEQHCPSAKSILIENYNYSNAEITNETLRSICPALIYLLDSKACAYKHSDNCGVKHNAVDNLRFWSGDVSVLKVWLASILSVLITSIGGVATIFIIRPLFHSTYYTIVVQFLIALAIGSLTGDALLHLLPHALFKPKKSEQSDVDSDSDRSHIGIIYRCLTSLAGIYFFFLVQRVTTLYQTNRSYKRRGRKNKKRNGDRLCNPFHKAYGDLPVNGNDEKVVELPQENGDGNIAECTDVNCDANIGECTDENCDASPNRVVNHKVTVNDESPVQQDLISKTNVPTAQNDRISADQVHAEHTAHTHSHAHGHLHNLMSVQALAWTVIIGDGMHNFCDGMAIGAAFAGDFSSGISTAIAVFCHELPHELGDFAVLLQAGMSIRMALIANVLSSLLCLFGMIAGIVLIQVTSDWIFMLTAGMFLYIALVNMMPELTLHKNDCGGGAGIVFIVQNVGFCLGALVMLIISIVEHRMLHHDDC